MTERKTGLGKSLFSAGGIALLLLALVLLNLLFSRVNLRWDLTQDRVYSLSAGTKKILSNLKHDVTIRVFYTRGSANLPVTIKNYAGRLIDFLDEYEKDSNGKVKVEVIDPKPDSEEEEWAQKYGIEGIDLPTGEKIYLGLVATAADQEETIKMLDPSGEKRLEYDITRIISRLQSPKKTKLAIISTLPVFGSPPSQMNPRSMPSWLFITELKKTYDVEELNPYADISRIPPDTDLLVVIHPRDLQETLLYAIDQYVVSGGNAIVLVDPNALMDMNPGMMKASSMERLFTTWGVKMDKNMALVDFSYATRLRTEDNRIENNPLWISLPEAAFNKENPVTAKLESMLLPVTGVFEKLPGSKFDYEPLLTSSENSALTEAFKARFGVDALRRDFSPTPERYDLAVRLRGTFETAFKEGRPKSGGAAKDAGKQLPAHLAAGVKPSTLILAADTDFLYDGYYVNRQKFLGFEISNIFNDNLNFFLNSVEMLSGADALIDIRSRGTHERPFERVKALEARAEAKWLTREQELVRRADATNQKLQALEKQKDASQNLVLTEEQEAEIQKFHEEKIRINRELKKVRRNLRADIESLGAWIKFFNIFFVPLLVSIGGGLYALYRRRKIAR
jgi:ABC-type uncharacterized transport system involved in gliding motility auxiliary subunit